MPQLRRLVAGFAPLQLGFKHGSGHVGFVVDEVALGQVFSEFGFPCQSSFHQLLHSHHHLSYGAGTNRPNSGRSTKWTQSHPTKNNNTILTIYRYYKSVKTGISTNFIVS
jgi:hypothetical protein